VRPAERALEVLALFSAAGRLEQEGPETIVAAIPKARVPAAVAALADAGLEVFAVERQASSLEEAFLEVTGGETV
jgi:hypothetical protein